MSEASARVPKRSQITYQDLLYFLLNFIVILVALFVVNVATLMLVSEEYVGENSLLPLQSLETQIVYRLQKAMGYNVEIRTTENMSMPTVLVYPDMVDEGGRPTPDLEITGICTGFREMAVMTTLVLLIGGVRWSLKMKWALILSGLLFVENLLRIFLIHPVALAYGWDFSWNKFHQFFWEYGQLMTIVVLFLLWYTLIASRGPERPGWRVHLIRYPPRPLLSRIRPLLRRGAPS